MKRKIIFILLAICFALSFGSMGVLGSSILPFRDVRITDWYAPAVEYVYSHGLMNGTSPTTFEPNGILTRAQVAQVLYNLEDTPLVSDTDSAIFSDVTDTEQWYYKPVIWAKKTGVVHGYEDGTFHPQAEVTRQEFAQMLYNYAKFKGYDLTPTGNLHVFPDAGSVGSWAETALIWANGNSLINGSDGYLLPRGFASRAQAASILMRFLQNVVGVPAEEPEVGDVNPETLPKSLLDFLEQFVVWYRSPPISYEGEYEKEYDSYRATDGTSNIVASIVNNAPCVDFSVYPGIAPQRIWNEQDPVGWSISGGYALYDGPTVDWIAQNIFNVSEVDLETLVQRGEEDKLFLKLEKERGEYEYYVPLIGIGGLPWSVEIQKAQYDGQKYRVEYDLYCLAPQKTYSGTYSTVVEYKEIDSQYYWSMYSHTQTNRENDIIDSVEFEIQRQDHSYYNDLGRLVIEHYYDKLVVKGDSQVAKAINASVEGDQQDFFSRNTSTMDAVFDYYANSDPPYTFFNTMDGEVTYNQNSILSLRQTFDWFLGGVHNTSWYGLTFDLNSGEKLVLSDLFPQMSKSALSSLVKTEVKEYINANLDRGWWEDAKEQIDAMDIDTIDFCIEDGTVVVFFEVYQLTPGASGPVQVNLSLTVK